MLKILNFLTGILTGGQSLADQFRKAYEAKLNAENDEQRLQADLELKRIEAAIETAKIANEDRWSATSIGRYLIVIPFGIWWTLIFVDSIIAADWDILALPQDIMQLAVWLVPTIVIGDVAKGWGKYFRKI